MILNIFPIAPMLIALIIPLLYSIIWKRDSFLKIAVISLCCLLIVVLYPLVTFLSNLVPSIGYFIGKLILFTILPLFVILYFERWTIKNAISQLGITKKNLGKSIFLGVCFLIITVIISIATSWGAEGVTDIFWNIIMFFEAFNEEFLFRGVLFLYLWKLTDIKVAYTTSILAFILAHPGHFTQLFILSTIAQGILLAIVTHKTKNIIGPWISHGLNRVIPQIIRVILF